MRWVGKNSKPLSGRLGNTPLAPTKDYSDVKGDGGIWIFIPKIYIPIQILEHVIPPDPPPPLP